MHAGDHLEDDRELARSEALALDHPLPQYPHLGTSARFRRWVGGLWELWSVPGIGSKWVRVRDFTAVDEWYDASVGIRPICVLARQEISGKVHWADPVALWNAPLPWLWSLRSGRKAIGGSWERWVLENEDGTRGWTWLPVNYPTLFAEYPPGLTVTDTVHYDWPGER